MPETDADFRLNNKRRAKLLNKLDVKNGIGLEFGPLNKPIVKKSDGDIRYVDVKDTEGMKAFIGDVGGYKSSEYVDIDYVWSGGSFRDVVGPDIEFDYSIASHVIEHTPNMLGWLDDIASVLKEGGIIALAIPDKRYTFDVIREVTPPAVFIDNWVRRESVPRAMHIFDHYSQVVQIWGPETELLWKGEIDPSTIARYHSDEIALQLCIDAQNNGSYTDCHAYTFTPASFENIITMATRLNILDLKLLELHESEYGSIEFIALLKKVTSPKKITAPDRH